MTRCGVPRWRSVLALALGVASILCAIWWAGHRGPPKFEQIEVAGEVVTFRRQPATGYKTLTRENELWTIWTDREGRRWCDVHTYSLSGVLDGVRYPVVDRRVELSHGVPIDEFDGLGCESDLPAGRHSQ